MDQRFGGPLPHQLPNPPPTYPTARISGKVHSSINPLSRITLSFPSLSMTVGQVIDVLLSMAPVLLPDLHGLVESY